MTKNEFSAIPMFKIIIRICIKNVEICGKTSKCLPKRCLLIFYIFYLNEKELNQQVCLTEYGENQISNSTSHKKKVKTKKTKKWKKRSKSIIELEKLLLVTLVSNYYKLPLLPLLPWRTFEKQNLVLNLESCYCYWKISYIFIASMKDLNVLQINTES